jgi:hypothetical protein
MVRWHAAAAAAIAAAAILGGCYGGLYLTLGPVDNPPSVSLAASPASAARGETISLIAAASDDYRVAEVAFYRVDAGGNTLLGRDSSAPYAIDTVIPPGAGSAVSYFARATDDAGQVGESPPVSVVVH